MSYNKVFESLVEGDADIVGLIAYGLYKEYKRNQYLVIKSTKKRNPNKTELKQIEDFVLNNINEYKKKANELLDISIEQAIITNKATIYETYFKDYGVRIFEGKLDRFTSRYKPKSFWYDLLMETLGNLAWVIIIFVISVLIYFNNGGIQKLKDKVIEFVKEPINGKNNNSDSTYNCSDTMKSGGKQP